MSDFEEFKKLRNEISKKMREASGKEWIGRAVFRDLEEVKTEIGEIFNFMARPHI